jgi:hypothetical protein
MRLKKVGILGIFLFSAMNRIWDYFDFNLTPWGTPLLYLMLIGYIVLVFSEVKKHNDQKASKS